MANSNAVGWFEIPVKDMERAIAFYQKIFDVELQRNRMGDLDMAWFPWIEGGLGAAGSLVYNEDMYKPSLDGVLLYFTAQSGDVANELSKVEGAGGKVLLPKTLITDEIGYMGIFVDTEGNRIAVHSRE